MKTTITMTLIALSAASAFAAPPVIAKRQVNQQARIGQGVRSGSLTARETATLERREAALHREIRRDRVDGGGLSMAERAKINRQQNALSNEIYNKKHNARVR